ncbi:IS30 family transposase, partial [Exilibacterium tricleocarpae]
DYPQSYLNKIASKLNNRPRKTLGYRSPAAMLNEMLR